MVFWPAEYTCSTQSLQPRIALYTNYTLTQFTWDLECGETFNGTESGEFTSPGYPNAYTNGLVCDYKIITPPQDFVQIEFQDPFALESKLLCTKLKSEEEVA